MTADVIKLASLVSLVLMLPTRGYALRTAAAVEAQRVVASSPKFKRCVRKQARHIGQGRFVAKRI